MTKAVKRWWKRNIWLRFWRFHRPRLKVIQAVPLWGEDGMDAEVLRNIYHRSSGKAVRKWTAIRVVKVNCKTAWVRFASGGHAKFRLPRIKPQPQPQRRAA